MMGVVDEYALETISFHPRASLIHDFLTKDECEMLIKLGEAALRTREEKLDVRSPQGNRSPAGSRLTLREHSGRLAKSR
jgi:hypothetical protein